VHRGEQAQGGEQSHAPSGAMAKSNHKKLENCGRIIEFLGKDKKVKIL